eukprot:gene3053-biopygen1398
MAWLGIAWLGIAWLGLAWLGIAWLGIAWLGMAWLGLAWLGVAWLGIAWLGLAWLGVASLGNAWLGLAWFGIAWLGIALLGMAWLGIAWFDIWLDLACFCRRVPWVGCTLHNRRLLGWRPFLSYFLPCPLLDLLWVSGFVSSCTQHINAYARLMYVTLTTEGSPGVIRNRARRVDLAVTTKELGATATYDLGNGVSESLRAKGVLHLGNGRLSQRDRHYAGKPKGHLKSVPACSAILLSHAFVFLAAAPVAPDGADPVDPVAADGAAAWSAAADSTLHEIDVCTLAPPTQVTIGGHLGQEVNVRRVARSDCAVNLRQFCPKFSDRPKESPLISPKDLSEDCLNAQFFATLGARCYLVLHCRR